MVTVLLLTVLKSECTCISSPGESAVVKVYAILLEAISGIRFLKIKLLSKSIPINVQALSLI